MLIDTDLESARLKKKAKEQLLNDLSGDLTPEQLVYFGKVFDDVTSKYKFKRKNR